MKSRSLFFDTSLIYFIVIVIFVGVRIFANLVNIPEVLAESLNVFIQCIMVIIPLFLYKALQKRSVSETLSDFKVKRISFKAIIIAVLIGFIVYFTNLAVASFFNIFIYGVGYDPSFGMSSASSSGYTLVQFLGDLVVTAILPGICEEFCHRGLLMKGFEGLKMKKKIILVGILFGLMHLNIEQFFFASVIGMFLCLLVCVSGSIIPSMIVHFMNNAMGLYIVFAGEHNLPLGDFSSNLKNVLSGSASSIIFTILIIVVVLMSLLVLLTYLLFKYTRINELKKVANRALERKQREEILKMLDIEEDKENDNSEYDENEPEVIFRRYNGRQFVDINFKNNPFIEDVVVAKKHTLQEKAFLYATVFLGIVITISTLIWGIM